VAALADGVAYLLARGAALAGKPWRRLGALRRQRA
jgi:hypothetical protein